MTIKLYSSTDVARLLEVSPSALSNWAKRGKMLERLPEPAYEANGHPLWTREQLEPIIAEHIAKLTSAFETEGSDNG